MNNIFAVDIGGSKMVCAVLTPNGDIVDSCRFDYKPGYTVEMLFDMIKKGYEQLKENPCEYCGAAIPGLCDIEKGYWLYSPFSGIENLPVAKRIQEITGLRTFVDNDVNVSALAERYFGLCKNVDDFVWLTVSNGIGGGLYLNGDVYRGKRMTSGEIGHIIVEEENGRVCGCGNTGCLEAMASGASIGKIYKDRTGKAISAKDIAVLAREGEEEAIRVWREAGYYIGKASAHVINTLGIDTVVLGGGAAEAFDLLEEGANKALERFMFRRANPDAKILHSKLGSFAALKGCAALVIDCIKKG